MRQAGVARMQSEQHYGLALALGGGEVSVEELAQLYATLANGGQARSLRYVAGEPLGPAQQLLSPEAAFITLDMLRQTPRPDTHAPARPAVAWKTGTSWGFRDAWTAGVFGRYVLVVWTGNFDGSSNPALVGVEAAAPLFMRMVDALRAERLGEPQVAHAQPANLRRVSVCTATGDQPDAWCPGLSEAWFIAGKSPIRTSALHQAVWVDQRSGRTVCGPQANARQEVVAQWGSDMQRLFKQAGMPRRAVVAPECGLTAAGSAAGAPQITQPLRGLTYTQRMGRPEPLILRAEAGADAKTLFWFADDAFVGRSRPGEALAWLPNLARRYTLRVVDDQGRADVRDVPVELVP